MASNQTVKKYEQQDLELVGNFIKKVAMVDSFDEEIVKNAILAKQDANVTGMVSFEKHEQLGVIRYFIYEQFTNPDLLVNMFFELYAHAKERGVSQLVAVASNPYTYQLFELLGFIEIKKSIDFKIEQLVKSDEVSVMSIKL